MNEKSGKNTVRKFKNCMWCDFFEGFLCELGVELVVVKEEYLFKAAKKPHKTYGPAEHKECMRLRKEYNKKMKDK